MTRKQFELIAATIRNSGVMGAANRRAIALDFAENLANENPRFDRARFLAACGVAK